MDVVYIRDLGEFLNSDSGSPSRESDSSSSDDSDDDF